MDFSKKFKIDLHMHSTVSDGSQPPPTLIGEVTEGKIGIFSLTDHDAIDGCRQVRRNLKEGDPFFINGIEFSCKDNHGKYHILGYDYDIEGKSIQEAVNKGHNLRMGKVMVRLKFLKDEYNFTFSKEDLDQILSLPNPGKPHIGNLMTAYGYAESKDEAIDKYINKKKIPNAYLKPEEAIRAILDSGGIPVLAHPFFGSGGDLILGKEMEDRLVRLMDMGVQGVEAYYSGFSSKLIGEMLHLADKYQLYVTAGSDYHGTNKLVQLGDTNMVSGQAFPEGMNRFLERVYRV